MIEEQSGHTDATGHARQKWQTVYVIFECKEFFLSI